MRSKTFILSGLQVICRVNGDMGQGQRSRGSRSKVDLEGQGQRSTGQKCDFKSNLCILMVMFEVKVTWVRVKGHMSQGQRSPVKPSQKVMILAGGLTSTSSCIFC